MLPSSKVKKKVLLVGAGHCASLVIENVKSRRLNYEIIGLVDDNPKLKNTKIDGSPILGAIKDIPTLAKKYGPDEILIAMPSVVGEPLRKIVNICKQTDKPIKIIPAVIDMVRYVDEQLLPPEEKKKKVNIVAGKLREINYLDFIKRSPPDLDIESIKKVVSQSVVLVTGAVGSIGKAVSKELVRLHPKKLILVDINESEMFNLALVFPHDQVEFIIGDIRDKGKMERVFKENKPDVVIHAAAYKHVPVMEKNPDEAIKTNIFGTRNILDLSDKYNVKRFVLISTDKAVNPIGVMGMTKRICEFMVTHFPKDKTAYSVVRFGNVMGSNGSLFTIWEKQIKTGKLDVTHPEMTRYFMSIQEAAMLILETLTMQNESMFIFDMGKPLKIVDLAKLFIEHHGYETGKEVKLNFIGIREGEKLHEGLSHDDEELLQTKNVRIYAIKPRKAIYNNELASQIKALESKVDQGKEEELRSALKEILEKIGASIKSPT